MTQCYAILRHWLDLRQVKGSVSMESIGTLRGEGQTQSSVNLVFQSPTPLPTSPTPSSNHSLLPFFSLHFMYPVSNPCLLPALLVLRPFDISPFHHLVSICSFTKILSFHYKTNHSSILAHCFSPPPPPQRFISRFFPFSFSYC